MPTTQVKWLWLLNVNHRLSNIAHPPHPNMTSVTAKGIAWLFLKEVVRLHAVPDSIILDWDTKFTSTFWCELQQLMRTKLLMSTAFHLQVDGATNWANCLIKQILCSVVRDDQKDWAIKCPMFEVALNSSISTTRITPFKLNHSYMPWIDLPMATNTPFKGVSQFAQQGHWNLMCAHDAIIKHHVCKISYILL